MVGKRGGMPGGGKLSAPAATFVVAQLTRSYQIAGRAYIDAHMAKGAGGWHQVPVMELGGGKLRSVYVPAAGDQGDDNPTFAPGEETDPSGSASAQVYLLFDGFSPFPICLGGVQHPDNNLRDKTSDLDINGNKDLDEPLGHQDIIMRNGGATFAMDELGSVAFTPARKKSVFWILRELESKFLVVRKGKAGNERVLLARKMLVYLANLEKTVDNHEARIASLEAAMLSVVAFLAASPPVIAGGPLGKVTPYLTPYTKTAAVDRPTADDTLVSSLVHISDNDETENA